MMDLDTSALFIMCLMLLAGFGYVVIDSRKTLYKRDNEIRCLRAERLRLLGLVERGRKELESYRLHISEKYGPKIYPGG